MTEEEWLECDDPMALWRFAHGKAKSQRFRWQALEWGQRNRHRFGAEDVLWLDKYACWLTGQGQHPNELNLPESFYPLGRWVNPDPFGAHFFNSLRRYDNPMQAAAIAGDCACNSFEMASLEPLKATEAHKGRSKSKRAAQASLEKAHFEEQQQQRDIHRQRIGREFGIHFRDVAGNPFHPVTGDPVWFTPKVVAIATALYADRAFDRMPLLADALEEAGCVNPDVLLHCRGGGPHVSGCWVVDLLLGKE